jgi:hypothetical protein
MWTLYIGLFMLVALGIAASAYHGGGIYDGTPERPSLASPTKTPDGWPIPKTPEEQRSLACARRVGMHPDSNWTSAEQLHAFVACISP